MKNVYYTEQEIKYYSQIGLSAWRKYNDWLEEYQSEKEEFLMSIIRKKA